MLPRKRTVSRFAFYAALFTVSIWMWLNLPNDTIVSSHTLTQVALPSARTVLETRRSTLAKGSLELSHRHTNQSLEHIMKNMTLLKVNKTMLHDIIARMNSSGHRFANPHPFKYILNNPTVCEKKNMFLIIYVHTAPSHTKRRMVIRNTWANPKFYPDVNIRIIFVMGKTKEGDKAQTALYFESEQYGDIVQEDFDDTYRNLTYKGIAALKWINKYCKHAKYVLKTDDDIFVNMFTLLRHLKSLDRFGVQNKNLLMCLVWYKMPVMRKGKWKVTEEQWKDKYYPVYCSGSAFTMSTDVAVRMYNASLYTPFFWVDDFYITGLLPLRLNITHRQFMSTYVLNGKQLEQKFTGPQWFTYIFSHVHNLNIIQSVWNKLVALAKGRTQAEVKFVLPGKLPKVPKVPNK